MDIPKIRVVPTWRWKLKLKLGDGTNTACSKTHLECAESPGLLIGGYVRARAAGRTRRTGPLHRELIVRMEARVCIAEMVWRWRSGAWHRPRHVVDRHTSGFAPPGRWKARGTSRAALVRFGGDRLAVRGNRRSMTMDWPIRRGFYKMALEIVPEGAGAFVLCGAPDICRSGAFSSASRGGSAQTGERFSVSGCGDGPRR